MTLKFIFLFILFSAFLNTLAQTYSATVDDKEITQFMNWLVKAEGRESEDSKFKRKCVASKIMSWDSVNFISKNKNPADKFLDEYDYLYRSKLVDSIFAQADKDFILKQFTTVKDSVWRHGFNRSKLVNPRKQKRPRRYYYSLPLFSCDRQIVIIKKEFYCGNLCAYGGTYIYKKSGDHWYLFFAMNKWMS